MTEPSPPALSIRAVSVSYGRRKTVINGLDMDVVAGETFGLIGLNGVGKTTLIKTVLGLRKPDSGDIKVFGLERTSAPSKKKIAYLPERFDPPSFLKGQEFLRFATKLHGTAVSRDKMMSGAEDLMLDPDALKNRVQTYSKGMRQKLGLLSIFLTDCPLLILDEPMSGLDPRARTLVKDALARMRAEGRSVFLSSHILSDMSEICDRVGVLSGGVMAFTGKPGALCDAGGDANIERAFLKVIDNKKAA